MGDTNNDGRISRDELEAALPAVTDAQAVVDTVFKETDTNNDGFIDRAEFKNGTNAKVHPKDITLEELPKDEWPAFLAMLTLDGLDSDNESEITDAPHPETTPTQGDLLNAAKFANQHPHHDDPHEEYHEDDYYEEYHEDDYYHDEAYDAIDGDNDWTTQPQVQNHNTTVNHIHYHSEQNQTYDAEHNQNYDAEHNQNYDAEHNQNYDAEHNQHYDSEQNQHYASDGQEHHDQSQSRGFCLLCKNLVLLDEKRVKFNEGYMHSNCAEEVKRGRHHIGTSSGGDYRDERMGMGMDGPMQRVNSFQVGSVDSGNHICNSPICFNKAAGKCRRCKQVYYCCRTCQRDNWDAHKAVCSEDPVWVAAKMRESSQLMIAAQPVFGEATEDQLFPQKVELQKDFAISPYKRIVVLKRKGYEKFGIRLNTVGDGNVCVNHLAVDGLAQDSGQVQLDDLVMSINKYTEEADMLDQLRKTTEVTLELATTLHVTSDALGPMSPRGNSKSRGSQWRHLNDNFHNEAARRIRKDTVIGV